MARVQSFKSDENGNLSMDVKVTYHLTLDTMVSLVSSEIASDLDPDDPASVVTLFGRLPKKQSEVMKLVRNWVSNYGSPQSGEETADLVSGVIKAHIQKLFPTANAVENPAPVTETDETETADVVPFVAVAE